MQWSPDLAYVVGLIVTDGNLSKDGRHIDLTSKDLEQIQTFAEILKLSNKIGYKKSSYNSNKQYFRIQFGNVVLYRFLLSIGLIPNKTKILGTLNIPDKFFADFLRGHLDGDGCTYSYFDPRWKNSFMFYTSFVSASLEHLKWISDSIKKLYAIEGKIRFSGKSTYQLSYAKRASIRLLNRIYYKKDLPCLSRKRFKIEKALSIINSQAGVAKWYTR